MQCGCDRTGFPLLRFPRFGLSIHLLPVTKAQVELYLAEPEGPGNPWYDALLAVSPRASWRSFRADERERVFATGVLPTEALAFASWLGPSFRLPSRDEWRMVYNELSRSSASVGDLDTRSWSPVARTVVDTLSRQLGSRKVRNIALLERNLGLVEWTTNGPEWVGLGSPRHELHPNCWNPRSDDSIRDSTRRFPFVGFRLVGPLQ